MGSLIIRSGVAMKAWWNEWKYVFVGIAFFLGVPLYLFYLLPLCMHIAAAGLGVM